MVAALILGASHNLSRVIAPYDFAVGIDADGNAVIWWVNVTTGERDVCQVLGNLHDPRQSRTFALSHASPCPEG